MLPLGDVVKELGGNVAYNTDSGMITCSYKGEETRLLCTSYNDADKSWKANPIDDEENLIYWIDTNVSINDGGIFIKERNYNADSSAIENYILKDLFDATLQIDAIDGAVHIDLNGGEK